MKRGDVRFCEDRDVACVIPVVLIENLGVKVLVIYFYEASGAATKTHGAQGETQM